MDHHFILPFSQTLHSDQPPGGELFKRRPLYTHPAPNLLLSLSLSLFLPSNQPSGSVCVSACALRDSECRALQRGAMTRSSRHPLRPQPLQSPVASPPSTHTSATTRPYIHLAPPPPLPSTLHPPTCPLHWQSHIIIFSGRHTACVRLYH